MCGVAVHRRVAVEASERVDPILVRLERPVARAKHEEEDAEEHTAQLLCLLEAADLQQLGRGERHLGHRAGVAERICASATNAARATPAEGRRGGARGSGTGGGGDGSSDSSATIGTLGAAARRSVRVALFLATEEMAVSPKKKRP